MKKRFMCIMLISLLFSFNSISGYEFHEEISGMEYLLNERIEIMNEFLYGYKDMNSLEGKLNKIEAERLLKNDLDILYKVIDNPTDYELAVNVKVDKIHSLKKAEDGIYVNADLNWLMSGYDGEFNMVRNYDIKCVETQGQMYLVSLVILDD